MHSLSRSFRKLLNGTVSSVLFISSTSVYPETNSIVTEEDADKTANLFKAETRFLEQTKFTTTVIRFGGLMGSDRHPGRFFSGKRDIPGGNSPVNVIHQQDCVGIIKAVIQQESWNEIYNACADEHPSRRQFYTRASELLGVEAPHFLADQPADYKIVSSEKLKKKLQYSFIYPDPIAFLEFL